MIPLSAALPLQRSIFTFLDFNPHSIYSHLTIWRWEPQMRENMQYLSLNMTFSSSVCLPADLIILFFLYSCAAYCIYTSFSLSSHQMKDSCFYFLVVVNRMAMNMPEQVICRVWLKSLDIWRRMV